VGKWLSLNPDILLLNDPTKGVDAGARRGARRNLYEIILRLAEKGTSVILYASDNEEFIDNCDRVLIVFEGRVVKEIGADEISEEKLVVSSLNIEHPGEKSALSGGPRPMVTIKTRRTFYGILRDFSFPSILMAVFLIVVNATIQPEFFSFQIFRMNCMTFAPLILVSLAQGTVILVGAVDLSLGAGISLVTVVMASLMKDSVPSMIAVTLVGVCLALFLSLFNGFFFGYFGPPPLIMTFATSTIWFGIALPIMPTPGGDIPPTYYTIYSQTVAGFLPVPLIVLLVAIAFCLLLGRLKAFRHLYAVGGNERAARYSGINVVATKIFSFLVSGIFIALAALCVVGQTATGDARSGQGFTLNSVAAAVIGGISFSRGRGSEPHRSMFPDRAVGCFHERHGLEIIGRV
jgi:ribose transport system permease protein